MKARDTVIKGILATHGYTIEEAEDILNNAGRAIYQAAMKEVMEVIKNDAYFCDDLMDGDTMPNEPDRFLVQFSRDTWRAELKKWGLNDDC